MNTDNLIVISVLICCLSFCGDPDLHDALIHHLQNDSTQEVTVDSISDNADVLSVEDLKAIYACVDTKIHNQNNEVEFPCVKVRGDSF